jgi:23S rRNA (adenine2503-C2)-methyltransferase
MSSSTRRRTVVEAPKPVASPQELLELYRADIAALLKRGDAPSFRFSQLLDYMFHQPGGRFEHATTLPRGLRDPLEKLGASTLTVAASASSSDGATKLLLKAADGAAFETVVMRYRDRVTVCVSSQVGCPVGCGFCATGAMGLTRNLSATEIVDQVRAAAAVADEEGRRLSNLVFMGMGEPLLNLSAVLQAIRILTNALAMDMAHRAISVSTVGIPSGIRRLAIAEPQVNLAISLHASDDRTRALLIPPKFRHSIADILAAGWDHFEKTHRKLLVEYVLLGGVNDSLDDAHRLTKLLRGHVVAVNLLAWNPVPGTSRLAPAPEPLAATPGFRTPTESAVATFRQVLKSGHIEAVVRRSKGSKIRAACGQLAAEERAY